MQSFDLIEMWHNMAFLAKVVNVLLGVCSVYSLWVIIDRLFSLRSVRAKSVRFVLALRDQLKTRNVEGTLALATSQSDNPVARVVKEAMTEYREGTELLRRGGHDAEYDPVEAVERVIDRTKEREVADLKRGLGGLASISSAAPFIGLPGEAWFASHSAMRSTRAPPMPAPRHEISQGCAAIGPRNRIMLGPGTTAMNQGPAERLTTAPARRARRPGWAGSRRRSSRAARCGT